jgi:lysophospholipase L1-like esterase
MTNRSSRAIVRVVTPTTCHRASPSVFPPSILPLLALGVWTAVAAAGTTYAQKPVAPNPATTPEAHLDDSDWVDRHESIRRAAKAHPDTELLLIGDSITNNYERSEPPDKDFLPTWKQFYEPRKALNLGISGDTTANVLWRLDHGEVEGLHPKVAIVLIGTNNTDSHHQTAEQTESGIDAVVANLEEALPDTRIILLGILPTDISASKTERDRAVNRYLATCYGENPRVTFLDIGSVFLKNGAVDASLFYDPRDPTTRGKPLHPDTRGQRRMAEAIEPTLASLTGDEPRAPLATMTDINTAVIPVGRIELDSYDWYARHHAELELAKRVNPRVVLIGDSITHFWGGDPVSNPVNGPAAWQRVFGSMPVINMGFGWDRTQNVLWRLRQGELDGLSPKWVVLAIGTNNLTPSRHARANSPAEVADAIEAICHEIHQKSPLSTILLMAILPRGNSADSPLRPQIQATNRLLAARSGAWENVTFIDFGGRFLQPDGSIPTRLMPDGTHPSDEGYQLWADALIAAGVKP